MAAMTPKLKAAQNRLRCIDESGDNELASTIGVADGLRIRAPYVFDDKIPPHLFFADVRKIH